MSNRIVINNQEIDSPDDMPPDVRRMYDEAIAKMGSGDVVPGASGGGVIKTTRTAITVNGKTYHSVAEMPDEVRQMYQAAMVNAGIGGSAPDKHPGVRLELTSGGKPAGQRAAVSFEVSPSALAIIVSALIAALVAWFVLHGVTR